MLRPGGEQLPNTPPVAAFQKENVAADHEVRMNLLPLQGVGQAGLCWESKTSHLHVVIPGNACCGDMRLRGCRQLYSG